MGGSFGAEGLVQVEEEKEWLWERAQHTVG